MFFLFYTTCLPKQLFTGTVKLNASNTPALTLLFDTCVIQLVLRSCKQARSIQASQSAKVKAEFS